MRDGVRFDRLCPDDFLAIERQPSQERLLGVNVEDVDDDASDALCAQPAAWAARHHGRLVAIFGVAEQYPGAHGVAWAILGKHLGAAHLAVTRKAREVVHQSGLNRIELIAKAADTPFHLRPRERIGGQRADLRWALDAKRITPECRWALLLGFEAAHVMHGYGPKCETHVLFEWFGGAGNG